MTVADVRAASPGAPGAAGAPGASLPDATGRGIEGLDFAVSPRVVRAARLGRPRRESHDPQQRPLRVFALDPSAGALDGATAVVSVPYERLEQGPCGAFIQVVDDGLTGLTGDPIPDPLRLDDAHVLIGQGRLPSVTDQQFRAQMAYAVCSATRAAFRRALGREPSWGFDTPDGHARLTVRSCVPGLRNAAYDGARGEIRLGAFVAEASVRGRNVPNQTVCTALIHDVVAHEMAHALLDGMRARFLFPSNPDVLAFHEAFSDLVALFQRFSYRDVVRAAIRQTRGSLDHESVLAQIGRQFAQTAGVGDALRSAILDSTRRYDPALDPHTLGEVLLAAVFGAYRTVFRRKAARYVRLATGGTGVLPDGELPELLVDRLTEVAAKTAEQFLGICIRAIDYCPPVDLTFGEYLRAVITADADLVPDDPWGYREAWVDAFREHGIYPRDVRALTQDALVWRAPDAAVPAVAELSFARLRFGGDPAEPAGEDALREQAVALGALVADPRWRRAFGFACDGDPDLRGDAVDVPVVESIRTSRRVGPDGQVLFDLVGEVIQRRRVAPRDGKPGLEFFGGSTVIVDPHGRVRYLVRKSVLQEGRLAAQQDYAATQGSAFWTQGADAHAFPTPRALLRLHAHREAPAESGAPRPVATIPPAHLQEDEPSITRQLRGAWAYPLGEPGRPRRDGATPAERARQLLAIAAWLDVERSPRYAPVEGRGCCHVYAADYCYLAGAYLPRVWWTGGALAALAAGTAVTPANGTTVTELAASALFDWLVAHGPQFGWRPAGDVARLQQAANAGAVALVCAQRAGTRRSGHVTVVLPEHAGHAAVADSAGLVPLQSQAGAVNRQCFATRWWTPDRYREPGLWVHD